MMPRGNAQSRLRLTGLPMATIRSLLETGRMHPADAKKECPHLSRLFAETCAAVSTARCHFWGRIMRPVNSKSNDLVVGYNTMELDA